jgi:hypothetical protein
LYVVPSAIFSLVQVLAVNLRVGDGLADQALLLKARPVNASDELLSSLSTNCFGAGEKNLPVNKKS